MRHFFQSYFPGHLRMNKQLSRDDDYDINALILTREELSEEVFGLLPMGLFPVLGQDVRRHRPHLHHLFQVVLALRKMSGRGKLNLS